MRSLSGSLLLGAIAGACASADTAAGVGGGAREPVLVHVTSIRTSGRTAEIVSLRPGGPLLVSNSEEGTVDLFDLSDPESPRPIAVFDLRLAPGEELTSVALHPTEDYFLAAIRAAEPGGRGRVGIFHSGDGSLLGAGEVGVEPDAVVIDPTGRFALVANEAESFQVDGDGGLVSRAGSLTCLRLAPDPRDITAREIELTSLDGVAGVTGPDAGRELEREIDGETVLVPLSERTPAFLEPEVVAFAPDGNRAYVTLQENDAVAVVDVPGARIVAIFGLGTTSHPADVIEDGRYDPSATLLAFREPDGIAVTPDGALFVTADEGDTDPKTSRTPAGMATGGGRTVSVFDARTGRLLGDTGGQIDDAAHSMGTYPDDRSDSKGSEPEMVVVFELEGTPHAAVGLERANAVALVSLADPGAPRVVSLALLGAEDRGPEGVAHLRDPGSGRHYVYTANEESGTLAVLRVDLRELTSSGESVLGNL